MRSPRQSGPTNRNASTNFYPIECPSFSNPSPAPGCHKTQRKGSQSTLAKYQLASGGIWVTQQSLQLHGDIGLYFKRMYALNARFGDVERPAARFADAG